MTPLHGEVYVVADASGLVKVGYSADTKRRLGNLSYWCNSKPLRVVIVRKYDERMARSVEKLAHDFLGCPMRHSGGNAEWFKVSPKEAIKAVDRAARRVRRFRRETDRVEKSWTEIRKHWPRRHGVKVKDAHAAIEKEIAPRKVSIPWLYANVK